MTALTEGATVLTEGATVLMEGATADDHQVAATLLEAQVAQAAQAAQAAQEEVTTKKKTMPAPSLLPTHNFGARSTNRSSAISRDMPIS